LSGHHLHRLTPRSGVLTWVSKPNEPAVHGLAHGNVVLSKSNLWDGLVAGHALPEAFWPGERRRNHDRSQIRRHPSSSPSPRGPRSHAIRWRARLRAATPRSSQLGGELSKPMAAWLDNNERVQ